MEFAAQFHNDEVCLKYLIESRWPDGFICPHCRGMVDIFKKGCGEEMAQRMGVPFLGRIPMSKLIVEASDEGHPFVETQQEAEVSRMFARVVDDLIGRVSGKP